MPNRLMFISSLLFILFSFSISQTSQAFAAISACAVTVSPNTLSGGTSSQLVFSITNNDQDSNLLYWVKIVAPTSDYTLTSGDGPNLGGVSISDDKSTITINTTLSGGETGNFTIGVTTGASGVSASSFTVQASSTSAGANPTTCTGDSAVSITANTEAILTISNIKITASDTTASV